MQDYIEEEPEGELPEQQDGSVPLEQRRALTQEELQLIREYRRAERAGPLDLERFVRRQPLSREERLRQLRESKDPDAHKSGYWNRKDTTRKSRTNKRKQMDKPALMMLRSTAVRRKQTRSAREKQYVRRKHAKTARGGSGRKVTF